MQLVASLIIVIFTACKLAKFTPWKVLNPPVSYRRDIEKQGRDTEMHGLVSLVRIGKHAMYKVCALKGRHSSKQMLRASGGVLFRKNED